MSISSIVYNSNDASLSDSSRPESLHDLQLVRGQLSAIEPYTPGFILAAIGKRLIILPAEFQRKLARHMGYRAEVLKLDGEYTVRRLAQ